MLTYPDNSYIHISVGVYINVYLLLSTGYEPYPSNTMDWTHSLNLPSLLPQPLSYPEDSDPTPYEHCQIELEEGGMCMCYKP